MTYQRFPIALEGRLKSVIFPADMGGHLTILTQSKRTCCLLFVHEVGSSYTFHKDLLFILCACGGLLNIPEGPVVYSLCM
jgi:hypothetical protein